ncbi:MAG: winged helix-turn-helix transcriptional regulator [Candidatus Thorarchaeota archaeon]
MIKKIDRAHKFEILLRQSFDESLPRVEYRLTQTGIQLYEKLCGLNTWTREECHSGGLNITQS